MSELQQGQRVVVTREGVEVGRGTFDGYNHGRVLWATITRATVVLDADRVEGARYQVRRDFKLDEVAPEAAGGAA